MRTRTPRELKALIQQPPLPRRTSLPFLQDLQQLVRKAHPYERMPTFNRHFYTNPQPETFCPLTAAILSSLRSSTTSGITSLLSLLHERITSPHAKKHMAISKLWRGLFHEVHTATKSSLTSNKKPLSLPNVRRIRTSVDKMQLDIHCLLRLPPLDLSMVPTLLHNPCNLRQWIQLTPISRAWQLRALLNDILALTPELRKRLNVDSPRAGTVAEWVTSKHLAGSTTV